jgi:hypothetical protein
VDFSETGMQIDPIATTQIINILNTALFDSIRSSVLVSLFQPMLVKWVRDSGYEEITWYKYKK